MKGMMVSLTVLALAAGAPYMHTGQAMAKNTAQTQVLAPAGSQPAVNGPADYFTGTVTIRPLFGPKHPDAPFGAAYVSFAPGARSFWHTHPAGQHLIVTEGVGLTGTADGKVESFKAGDALWCPAGVKHWHGAAPDSGMTHLALTGALPDGSNVQWMEAVSDEQYNGGK